MASSIVGASSNKSSGKYLAKSSPRSGALLDSNISLNVIVCVYEAPLHPRATLVAAVHHLRVRVVTP